MDARLSSLTNFASIHHSIPTSLDPELATLPPGFTACIIGAGAGIGEHIAYSYAKARASRIVLAAQTVSDLQRVKQNIESLSESVRHENDPVVEVHVTSCDVASASSVSALAEFVKEKCGRLDVLIPNAGYAGPVTLKMADGQPEWVQRAFDVNAMGTYHAAHHFVPLLLESENGAKEFQVIGSAAALLRRGPIANSGYCVSKLAQMRLVELLDEQYSNQGLLAVVIHPGAVKTRMAEGNTPEVFLPYLVDPPDLCGATCVWISKQSPDMRWLSGRYLSANWDPEELMSKKEEILSKDLLKLSILVS